MKINQKIANLNKAVFSLRRAVAYYQKDFDNKVIEAGLIQNFEMCIEQSWKTLKSLLFEGGINVTLPREIFIESGKAGFIKNTEIWLKALQDRNLTSHIYQEELATQIANKITDEYVQLFDQLINELKNRNN